MSAWARTKRIVVSSIPHRIVRPGLTAPPYIPIMPPRFEASPVEALESPDGLFLPLMSLEVTKMTKKILAGACTVLLAMAIAHAGDTMKTGAASEHMQKMKAEMANCTVCKAMVPHLDSLGPVMTMEVANLNDGVAIMHGVSDPAKTAEFHTMSAEMHKNGQACMTMTDEQAKTGLCSMCQEMRATMKAGAKMSAGNTKTGDIMVLTSSDPALKTRIDAIGEKCAMMGQQKSM